MGIVQDLSNLKFGMLTVLNKTGKDKHGRSIWMCFCECGNTVEALGLHLKRGSVISCKCSRRLRLEDFLSLCKDVANWRRK